jgi:hypothetical protein
MKSPFVSLVAADWGTHTRQAELKNVQKNSPNPATLRMEKKPKLLAGLVATRPVMPMESSSREYTC